MSASTPLNPVFILTHEFYPKRGGIATFTEEMAKATAAQGYDIEVWAQSAPPDTEKFWPFKLHRLPVKGTHDLTCQLKLARELIGARRRLRYATVYLPEPGPMLAMMLLQFAHAFRPHRLILTFHGSEILRFHHNPIKRLLTRRLIKHASRISTLTHYTHDLLCRHFPEATRKTFLTPGALRSDFALGCTALSPVQKGNKLVVLTVGRLHPRKGQLITLHALQALPPADRAKIEYWIVGAASKGHYDQQLREATAQSDLAVRFLGDLPDEQLDAVYAQADVFAMTSIDHGHSVEGFGLVYLEASAHGLPIIAHSIGGVAEAVINGVTGLLIPPNQPERLTTAFERLISDATLRQGLGHAGRTWARRNCWKQSADLLFNPSFTPSPFQA